MIVLPKTPALSYTSHCPIAGRLVQIRTSSVVQQLGMCFENSGPRRAISELVQRCGEALQRGFEPRLESLALRLGLVGRPRGRERRAALVHSESVDTERVVRDSLTIRPTPSTM